MRKICMHINLEDTFRPLLQILQTTGSKTLAELRNGTRARESLMILHTEINIKKFLPTFDFGGYASRSCTVLKH